MRSAARPTASNHAKHSHPADPSPTRPPAQNQWRRQTDGTRLPDRVGFVISGGGGGGVGGGELVESRRLRYHLPLKQSITVWDPLGNRPIRLMIYGCPRGAGGAPQACGRGRLERGPPKPLRLQLRHYHPLKL